jgi:hypothetical protein
VTVGGAADASDGVREISPARAAVGAVTAGDAPGYPVTLSEPGSYVLTASLVTTGADTAIEITTDDVSLDLNGFAVECRLFLSLPCSGGTGIAGAGRDNVRLANGSVRGHGGDGVVLGDGAHVEDVRIVDNLGDGLSVGAEAVVGSCLARGNTGAGISAGDGSRVRDSVATRNDVGIVVGQGSTVSHSTARANTTLGIGASSGSTVVGNAASDNLGIGISVYMGSTVVDNASESNQGDGFDLGLPGVGFNNIKAGRARDNSATGNVGFGMRMDAIWGYAGNVLTDNNGGNANPQLTGGVSMGTNLCGGDTVCP